jgi:hydrogenase nickel insertion protein HypA
VHETSIALSIYETARSVADEQGCVRLESVKVAVGELSAIEPELLAFAWQAITHNGPDANSKLEIEWHPARQNCPNCREDKKRSEGSWFRICPDCGQPLDIEGGNELDILQVSFLSADEEPDESKDG